MPHWGFLGPFISGGPVIVEGVVDDIMLEH